MFRPEVEIKYTILKYLSWCIVTDGCDHMVRNNWDNAIILYWTGAFKRPLQDMRYICIFYVQYSL